MRVQGEPLCPSEDPAGRDLELLEQAVNSKLALKQEIEDVLTGDIPSVGR